MTAYALYLGDCREVLAKWPENSFDSVVCDPPYGISFMGKGWDHGVPGVDYWKEVLRVLKPGGHLLAFGGSRTFHRMFCAIEDAGFELRDTLMWVYGSGFPKSLNIAKALDKAAGAEGEQGPMKRGGERLARLQDGKRDGDGRWGDEVGRDPYIYLPATDIAKTMDGWGTALKPAHEPICMARKPLDGTVAQNVKKWGTGGLNIDACRVGTEFLPQHVRGKADPRWRTAVAGQVIPEREGRWPANFIHDGSDEVVELFPESNGGAFPAARNIVGASNTMHRWKGVSGPARDMGDSGSAARFFYCAKASRKDRDSGLDGYRHVILEWTQTDSEVRSWESEAQKVQLLVAMEQSRLKVIGVSGAQRNDATEWSMMLNGSDITGESQRDTTYTTEMATSSTIESKILSCFRGYLTNGSTQDANCETAPCGSHAENAANGTLLIVTTNERMALVLGADRAQSPMRLRISVSAARSGHPTVKPTDLMRYLCRVVTPPGGAVLDPFAGSGSTGKAAILEGFEFVGVEKEQEYLDIAKARIEHAVQTRDKGE